MPNANEIASQVGSQVSKTIRRAEDFTVETVKSWSATVERVVPEYKLPFEQVPNTKAAAATAFAIAQQAVEAQRGFVLNLLDTLEERLGIEGEGKASAKKEPAGTSA